MGKDEVEVAIRALEGWSRTIDNWVLICAAGVAIFLAAEVVFSVVHWRNENRLRPLRVTQAQLHADELVRLNNDTARLSAEAESAKGQIAKANARTAEAELRIRRLEPRNLNWSAFVDALRNTPQCSVEILYFADDFDSMSLAGQIDLAMRAAGWPEPSRNPIEKPLDWTGSTPMAVDGQPTGVTLVARDKTRRADEFSAGNMLPQNSGPLTPFIVMERAILAGIGKLATWVNGAHAPPEGMLRIVVAPRE